VYIDDIIIIGDDEGGDCTVECKIGKIQGKRPGITYVFF
jgi:hypothetical protein